jgi:hypothetical protein
MTGDDMSELLLQMSFLSPGPFPLPWLCQLCVAMVGKVVLGCS